MAVAEVERFALVCDPPFSPVWDPILTAANVLNGAMD